MVMYGFNPGDIARVFGPELRVSNMERLAAYFHDVARYFARHGQPHDATHARAEQQRYRRMIKRGG